MNARGAFGTLHVPFAPDALMSHSKADPPPQPRVTLASINREAYIYFGAGATVAWQMAMPGVGRGVANHSSTLERPLERLRATMAYVYALSLGTDAHRATIAFVTRGLLPPRLREMFGFEWTARDAHRWQQFRRWAPRLYWATPRVLRHLPAKYYLGQLETRDARPG